MSSNLHVIIMAGGIGSRFWPLSRKNKPKQFLDVLGTGRTLLQLTFDRLHAIVPAQHIWIVTHQDYHQLVLQQLPELDASRILLEPERKNTAACILLAAKHIEQIDPGASTLIAPSDHLILKETQFHQDVKEAQLHIDLHPDHVLTFGIKPSRADTGYGYIRFDGEEKHSIFPVQQFVEKPNAETALAYLSSGKYVWNSGMFMWQNQTILRLFQQHAYELYEVFANYIPGDDIGKVYQKCPSISVDYAIMEKTDKAFVMAVDFGWSDLGTWASLYEVHQKDEHQNALLSKLIIAHHSQGNMVHNDEVQKLIALYGVDNLIIINTPTSLLICDKSKEQNIKQLVHQIEQEYGSEQI